MKKIIGLLGLCFLAVVGLTVWDYTQNNRYVSAELYTVSVTPYREQMEFTSPIRQQDNLYLMGGAVRKIDQVAVGDIATVYHNNHTYRGYLYRLEPAFDDIYYATVSVISQDDTLTGDATAIIHGKTQKHLIFVPKECLTIDESGQDAVFVVQDGYAMLRNVKRGNLYTEEQQQIQTGIFASEKIIISPQNIRTGDRILLP